MDDIKSILRGLNIYKEAEKGRDGSYVIDIEDMDEFGKYFSLIDMNSETEELQNNSLLTIHNISMNYAYRGYILSLISDNDQDTYKLVIQQAPDDYEEDEYEDEEGNDNLEDSEEE